MWSGSDHVSGGKCRVAWEVACRPHDVGGLGLVDLRKFGIALRLCWEWLCRVDGNRPWTLLLSTAVQAAFHEATDSILGDGMSTIFWLDRWMEDGSSVREVAPASCFSETSFSLCSFVLGPRPATYGGNGHRALNTLLRRLTEPSLLGLQGRWAARNCGIEGQRSAEG